jgi:frataxin
MLHKTVVVMKKAIPFCRILPRSFASKVLHQSYVSPIFPKHKNTLNFKLFSTYGDASEMEFHRITDETLENIQDNLCILEDLIPEAEVSLSQGVLSVNLGPSIGAWVINKQTPNKQIWWSSPISGPRRYEYVLSGSIGGGTDFSSWRNSKDGSSLIDTLREEMFLSTGTKFFEGVTSA